MKWKIFLTAFINLSCVVFPYNIIGCGPGVDPYDYYTTFFQNNLSDAPGYKPFYYSGYTFLYDDHEPASPADILAQEWADWAGNPVTAKDAGAFINKSARKDVNILYQSIEKNQPLKLPVNLINNSMVQYFAKSKNLEALGYVLYAKQAEPYLIGDADDWQPLKRDSVMMNKLAKNGIQLYNAARTDLFRLKYAYQVMRLYHYSNNFPAAVSAYDQYVFSNPAQSVLQPLSLALKAGALYHMDNKPEAAYLFSKAFDATIAKRLSNFISFKWSIQNAEDRKLYLSKCRNDHEKAVMLSLFAMGDPANHLSTIKQVFALDPGSSNLEILATREINKLEEKFLTPSITKERGGRWFYNYWDDNTSDSIYRDAKTEAQELSGVLNNIAQSKKADNPALFQVAAAYAAFMVKDYPQARQYINSASKMEMNARLKDQLQLTSLLVTINEKQTIDAAFEQSLLPSLKWMQEKASSNDEWKKFYRNLMSEILANQYHKQGDLYKETMMIGVADRVFGTESGKYSIDFMRSKLDSKEVQRLYAYLNNKQKSAFDQYISNYNVVHIADVIDFAGTAYLREYDFQNAITWFKKITDKKTLKINKDPFIDLTYDREEKLAAEKNTIAGKLEFAQEMMRLAKLAESDKVNAAKHYYKMATGYYNMTYYGHTWELVEYSRSGVDGYHIPKNATAFQKEYYGCFTSENYFRKAMDASTDPNFKVRCLFMMAKCSQKQVHKPQYEEFGYDYAKYDAADSLYFPKFKKNKYFPELVKSYSNTAFYKQVFSTCSYLRDFVKR